MQCDLYYIVSIRYGRGDPSFSDFFFILVFFFFLFFDNIIFAGDKTETKGRQSVFIAFAPPAGPHFYIFSSFSFQSPFVHLMHAGGEESTHAQSAHEPVCTRHNCLRFGIVHEQCCVYSSVGNRNDQQRVLTLRLLSRMKSLRERQINHSGENEK